MQIALGLVAVIIVAYILYNLFFSSGDE